MALTLSTDLRSAIANLVDATINTGSGTALLRFRDGTNTIADIELQNPAFGDASSGVIALNGTPLDAIASAGGDVDNFQFLDRDGAVQISGNVTATGLGGDITIDNISINAGQKVTIESLNLEVPA